MVAAPLSISSDRHVVSSGSFLLFEFVAESLISADKRNENPTNDHFYNQLPVCHHSYSLIGPVSIIIIIRSNAGLSEELDRSQLLSSLTIICSSYSHGVRGQIRT